MTKGYYSLIQYCPDFSRAEAANVGLVLLRSEPWATAVRVMDDVKGLPRRLGRKGSDANLLRDVQAIEYRLRHERFRCVEDFERFVRTRGNQIVLKPPRPMRVEAIEVDLDRMFAELVEPATKYNCHGMVFGSSAIWLQSPDRVLADGEYVQQDKPEVGDVVRYRGYDPEGRRPNIETTHTGIVVEIEANGTVVVHSKWGCGAEGDHELNKVPESYLHDKPRRRRGEPAPQAEFWRAPKRRGGNHSVYLHGPWPKKEGEK